MKSCYEVTKIPKSIGFDYDGLPRGAFWINQNNSISKIDYIRDIAEAIADYKSSYHKMDSAEKVSKITNIGAFIAGRADYLIYDFDHKIKESQRNQLKLEQLESSLDSSPEELKDYRNFTKDKDLTLGLEVRTSVFHALSEVRSFGNTHELSAPVGMSNLKAPLNNAIRYFPLQWNIDYSDSIKFSRGKILNEKRTSSSYSHETGKMFISNKISRPIYAVDSVKTIDGLNDKEKTEVLQSRAITHELSHFYTAQSPSLNSLQHEFLIKRSIESEFGTSQKSTLPDGCHIYPDHFVDPYMGRDYKKDLDSSVKHLAQTEIFSMGMESIAYQECGSLIGLHGYAPDPDHRNFVLGILATLDL